MADTASRKLALEIGRLLDEHKGIDTRVIDISAQSSWTDYFVITTVTSQGHLQGILRYLKELLDRYEIRPRGGRRRIGEDGWNLVDCGDVVVHLMDSEKRQFYDLENLWFSGEVVNHSSKSS